ncbi:MAG: ribosome maturation factor RimM [Anaerolineae bacterium]|nr:ribosome maturation factor RimM [Thermoflexales bacterium]MDW8406993.1 ribosome maturation factor RimM [Anaerolineae bacterium]
MTSTRTPTYQVNTDGLLEVGTVTRPHGISGEIRVQVPPEYATALLTVRRIYLHLGGGAAPRAYTVLGRRLHQDVILWRLEGIVTRNDAEALRGAIALVRAKDLPPLGAGRHYPHELIGLRVVTVDGAVLGEVYEVLTTGANDVYVVRQVADAADEQNARRNRTARETLLPAIPQVVQSIDLHNRVITVILLEGL